MTGLDAETMLVCATVAFAVPTAAFCILTATRYNTPAGRIWSVGPLALMASLTAVASDPGHLGRSVDAVVAGCLVFSVGAVRVGLRAHLGHRDTHVRWIITSSVVAALVCAVWPTGADALTGVMIAVSGVLLLYGLVDAHGPRTETIVLRVAAVAVMGWGATVVACTVAGSQTTGRLDDAETLSALALGQAVVLMALMTLRTQLAPVRDDVLVATSFLDHDTFLAQGVDRLERASTLGVQAQLFVLFTDGLDVIEAAYGRAAVGVATEHVARVTRAKVPASALIARLDGGQVAVLTTSSRYSGPDEIIAAVQTGLAATPAPERLPLRIDVSVRIAATDPTPAQLRASIAPLVG